MPRQVLIIANPAAREGQLSTDWPETEERIASLIAAQAGDAVVTETLWTRLESPGSALVREALEAARKSGKTVTDLIVAGGDGTVAEAVQGLFSEPKPDQPTATPPAALESARILKAAIVPSGRGNDFFKSVAGERFSTFEAKRRRAFELLRAGRYRPTDLIWTSWTTSANKSGGRFLANVASFGFPGLVVERVKDRAGWLGKTAVGKSSWAYIAQTATSFFDFKPVRVRTSVDGKPAYEGPIQSLFVLNGRYNAGGACWDAEANPWDGQATLLALHRTNPLGDLLQTTTVTTGHWENAPGAHLFRGRVIEVELLDEHHHPLLELDGDLHGPIGRDGAMLKKIRFEVVAGAWNLCS